VNERVSERGSGRVSKWVAWVGESERAGGLSRASTSYFMRTYGQCGGDWICRTYVSQVRGGGTENARTRAGGDRATWNKTQTLKPNQKRLIDQPAGNGYRSCLC
jgi:hypothetical protein